MFIFSLILFLTSLDSEKLFGYMLSYNYVEGIDFYMSKCPIIKRVCIMHFIKI